MMRWVFGAAALLFLSAPAYAWTNDALPGCGNGDVVSRIVERAAWAEHNTWHRGWIIHSVHRIHETALKDRGPSRIDRRYCLGVADLTNGRRMQIAYLIEAGMGFAGIGWRVEFCMPPEDPWRVYDAWCKAIRP